MTSYDQPTVSLLGAVAAAVTFVDGVVAKVIPSQAGQLGRNPV